MIAELWKDINGYEGIYRVSNMARIMSFYGKEPLISEYQEIENDTYIQRALWKDGNFKAFQLHRLVAFHFVPNPHNYPIIDHIDRNRNNNIYTNLEWVTYSENSRRWQAYDKVYYDQIKPGAPVRFIGSEHTCKVATRERSFITLDPPPPDWPYRITIKHVLLLEPQL